MIKSVLLGVLATAISYLLLVGVVFVANLLIGVIGAVVLYGLFHADFSHTLPKVLGTAGYSLCTVLSLAIGGFVAARKDRKRWPVLSFFVGCVVFLLWGLPSLPGALTHPTVIFWVDLALLFPSALFGGFYAHKYKPALQPLPVDVPASQ